MQDHETTAQSSVATDALNIALQQEKLTLESRVLNLETLVREKDEVPLLSHTVFQQSLRYQYLTVCDVKLGCSIGYH